jgi:hypothetical protein
MNQFVCKYAVTRFLPYRETEEFVNIGVLLLCEPLGFLGFRLEKRRVTRIREFFQELNSTVFLEGVKALEGELNRMVPRDRDQPENQMVMPWTAQQAANAFEYFTKPRRTLFCFSEPRVILSSSPSETLKTLFAHYVHRQFAQTKEYQEQLMRISIQHHLRDWSLSPFYRACEMGPDIYKMKFPFVHLSESGTATHAIRPLHLDRRDTTAILRKGDEITGGFRRLSASGALPDKCMVVVKTPKGGLRSEAANQVCEEVRKMNVIVSPYSDVAQLREFASDVQVKRMMEE